MLYILYYIICAKKKINTSVDTIHQNLITIVVLFLTVANW
jgi:hypothetical protein